MTAAMSWELDDEHEEFRASVRGFVDRHAIYLPNAIEACTAVHACNRIGAIYTILFSGFGPGKPVPPGTKGNLVLTQPFPTLARTVWDDPDRYRHAYFPRFPGCYCTNDGAVLDEDGHLWVLGRADDVINVAAHRISTLEIEAIATAHPQVAEAAVVGVYDATKGTVPVGFLTLLDGADPGQVKQEPQGDTSAMEDVSGLQAVQQAAAAASGT